MALPTEIDGFEVRYFTQKDGFEDWLELERKNLLRIKLVGKSRYLQFEMSKMMLDDETFMNSFISNMAKKLKKDEEAAVNE